MIIIILSKNHRSLQEISFLTATNVTAKNTKLLQKVFLAAKKLLLHVAGISAVAKSFATVESLVLAAFLVK
jgi:hypothetical protein